MGTDFHSIDHLQEHEARLFPVVRISSDREAELRATSAFLAMVRAVSEFGRAIVKLAGGPAGNLTCYTEVSFEHQQADAKTKADDLRPDGIIHVVRGSKEWTALIEVKVGKNPLDQDQFTKYHRLAGALEFDALITISNQPAQANGLPPVSVDKRRLRGVSVVHFSWERLLREAQMLSRKKEISDPDQKWMLDEWIKYVDDERSKIIEKPDLGPHWTESLDAARVGRLSTVSSGVADVVAHWDGFLRKAALRLRAQLGVDVAPRLSRLDKADPKSRLKRLHAATLKSGHLSGVLKVPRAVGDLYIDVLLQAKTVRYRISLAAPDEGRQTTRINWLIRQLRSLDAAPASLAITPEWDHRGLTSRATLSDVRAEGAGPLLKSVDGVPVPKGVMPRKFVLEWSTALRKGRGRSSAKVLEGIAADLERFYRDVIEQLVPYVPRAAKLPEPETQAEPLDSTPAGQRHIAAERPAVTTTPSESTE